MSRDGTEFTMRPWIVNGNNSFLGQQVTIKSSDIGKWNSMHQPNSVKEDASQLYQPVKAAVQQRLQDTTSATSWPMKE
jgi:hypothetical protein